MPRQGSGIYDLPPSNPVFPGDPIESDWANETMTDLETAMTESLSRNGEGAMNAALRLINGSVGTPGWGFTNEVNTGMYLVSAALMGLTVTGTQIVTYAPTLVDFQVPINAPEIRIGGVDIDTIFATDADLDAHINAVPDIHFEDAVADNTPFVRRNNAWLELSNAGIVFVQDAEPTTPTQGTLWFKSDTARFFVFYEDGTSDQWVEVGPAPGAGGEGGGASVTIQDTAPLSPLAGDMWFDSTSGRLNIFYDDDVGDPSAQWVEVGPAPGPLTTLTVIGGRGVAPVQSVTGSAEHTIQFNSFPSNPQGSFAAGGYTVPLDGFYDISAQVEFDWTGGGITAWRVDVTIEIDGVDFMESRFLQTNTTGVLTYDVQMGMVALTKDQVVSMVVFQSSGGAKNTGALAGTMMSVTRVGGAA